MSAAANNLRTGASLPSTLVRRPVLPAAFDKVLDAPDTNFGIHISPLDEHNIRLEASHFRFIHLSQNNNIFR